MKKSKIAIVGGGASGLLLANLLDKNLAEVYIFEKNNKLGKKILASGNGKCNFTNVSSLKNKYNDQFANKIIDQFTVTETLDIFKKLGLIYKNDEQGRCYPVSECSSSVLDCLKKNLKKVHMMLDCEIKNINCVSGGYTIEYNKKNEFFDFIICCSGSSASNLGSDKAYNYLKNLDVKIGELSSSLTPVIVKENIELLKGVRVKCLLKLLDGNDLVVYQENGEVLFKEDSLSGIAVFNASSYINRKKSVYKIVLDLSAGMSKEKLFEYINSKKDDVANIFKGFLNDKISQFILEKSKISSEPISQEGINNLVDNVCNLSFECNGLYPLKDSQVCSGGVSLSVVNNNLELKNNPNIYVAGELLDIDGVSGGYNLQFAWSSAGVIAKDINNKLVNKAN